MPCRDHKKPGISQAFCGPKGPIIPLHPQGTGGVPPETPCPRSVILISSSVILSVAKNLLTHQGL